MIELKREITLAKQPLVQLEANNKTKTTEIKKNMIEKVRLYGGAERRLRRHARRIACAKLSCLRENGTRMVPHRFALNVLVEQKKLQENIRAERNKLVNAVGT